MLRRSDYLIKWDVTFSDIFQDLFIAYKVDPFGCALFMQFSACEHADPDFLASTCRQHAGATDVLITLCWVNIELYLDFKTLDKFALLGNFSHF